MGWFGLRRAKQPVAFFAALMFAGLASATPAVIDEEKFVECG